MMYRSGWGTKENQEVTLAVRLKREFFECVLAEAVPSSFNPELFGSIEAWQTAVAASNVRLQWDPDHAPRGDKLERRAIQLGLRGAMLEEYARTAILEIEDISEFVAIQRPHATGNQEHLETPSERVFMPFAPETSQRLRLAV